MKPDGGISSSMAGSKKDVFWWTVPLRSVWAGACEASFGEAVSLNGYPRRWSIYFAGPSKFSVNNRKEVFGQLPVLLLLLRARCCCSVSLSEMEKFKVEAENDRDFIG